LAHLIWSKNLSVGIDVIDKQHMRIVSYINDLDDAMRLSSDPRARARIESILRSAIEYTESHFGFEEAMLEDVNYPFLKAHKKIHELFVRRMLDYQRRLSEGENITLELHETLTRWLVNHIKSEDMDYSRWIAKPDLQASAQTAQTKEQLKEPGWLSARLKQFFRT
jgi:hemerythrin